MTFEAGTFYELRSNVMYFTGKDVENAKEIKLTRGEIVLCSDIIPMRKGEEGRGKYARLLLHSDGANFVLFHRLSRHGRGAGEWREVNPMIVLAKADALPTL